MNLEIKDKETKCDKKNNDKKKAKKEKNESCRFLFDMIGRVLPKG